MILSLADARRVIAAGERRAHQLGQPMNIAVVDRDGNLVSHVRMDGAWTGSVDVSIRKAVDACWARAGVAGGRVFDLAAAGARWESPNGGYPADARGEPDREPGRAGGPPAAGGVPLLRDGAVVGAIGVSGGGPTQDQAVAQAAVAAL
ncbi:heme-binding protein [Pseudofrankia sp. DC12]|uniref:GlcG/HbpS family heme-binding protein n=1 Tax=Pseudofrankia sp. DC12 TaxID=683315 RepID=UPI000AFA376F|nr:heme-binding protein [Pseudofrankia sp. DC12]